MPFHVALRDRTECIAESNLEFVLVIGGERQTLQHATYLIDVEGNVVNTWPLPKYGYTIEKHAHFLDNGNLIRRIGNASWRHGWEESWPGTDPAAASTNGARL